MKSKNARFLRQGVVDRCRKMTPTQRLCAYMDHFKLVRQVHAAGELRRKATTVRKQKNA